MWEVTQRKNFLIVEGRFLVGGEQGQLTPEEWLYLMRQIEDDLVGVQRSIFARLEQGVRERIVERALGTVAV